MERGSAVVARRAHIPEVAGSNPAPATNQTIEIMTREIEFTPEKLAKLKKAYEQARKDKKVVFTFEGYEYAIEYAKWLINYLEQKFGQL